MCGMFMDIFLRFSVHGSRSIHAHDIEWRGVWSIRAKCNWQVWKLCIYGNLQGHQRKRECREIGTKKNTFRLLIKK